MNLTHPSRPLNLWQAYDFNVTQMTKVLVVMATNISYKFSPR